MAESTNIKHKAGVVAHRLSDDGRIEVLLVSARRHAGSWVFPVGTVDPGESLEQAAARECVGASGYRVETGEQLPSVDVTDEESTKRFTFFLARVAGEVDKWERDRTRRWVTSNELVGIVPEVFKSIARDATQRLSP